MRGALLALIAVTACGRSDGGDGDTGAAPATTAATSPGAGALASEPRPDAAAPPRLGEIRLRDLTPEEIRPEGIPWRLDELVAAALTRDFVRAEEDPAACRAAIAVGYALMVNRRPVASADAGDAHAIFEGELFCPKPDGSGGADDVDAYQIKLDAQRSFGGTAGGTSSERLLEVVRAAVEDGAASLFGQVRMRHASDAELRAALARSDHPGLLSEAASEAGERHLEDAVPDLVRLTAHANTRVATRAGAALGQLKSATPEVIGALVKMTEGADPAKHLVAIHALADFGTPEAKRYLESLAVGHPSAVLREIARERLHELGTELAPEP